MKDIRDPINILAKDKHKKLNLTIIMKILAQYYSSEKLEKYVSIKAEYVNQKNQRSTDNVLSYIYL